MRQLYVGLQHRVQLYTPFVAKCAFFVGAVFLGAVVQKGGYAGSLGVLRVVGCQLLGCSYYALGMGVALCGKAGAEGFLRGLEVEWDSCR